MPFNNSAGRGEDYRSDALVLLVLEGGASVAWSLPGGTSGKVPMQETQVQSLSQEDLLEGGMVCILQFSCLENPVRLQS